MAESAAHALRGHSGAAVASTLAADISAGATSLDGVDLSTWAAADDVGPFRFTLSDGITEEEGEATTVSGNTISGVTRGVGGTAAAAWSAGVTLKHTSSVRDFVEANRVASRILGVASVAAGDLYYVSSVSTGPIFSRLPKGTALQQLRMNAGATAPEWAAASVTPTFSGAYVKNNATQTVNNGAAAAVAFNGVDDADSGGLHDPSSNSSRVAAAVTGKHSVSYTLVWSNGATVTGLVQIYLKVNGTIVNHGNILIRPEELSASNTQSRSTSVGLVMTAADYVEVFFDNASGSNAILQAACSMQVTLVGV